jgi:hypothetical protein
MHVCRFPHLLLALFLVASAIPAIAQSGRRGSDPIPPIAAAPRGGTIDLYPVTTTKQKGGRFINTRLLPRLGYVGPTPAIKIERLLFLKKTHTTMRSEVRSADGKTRTVSNTVPAVEGRVSSADASAIADLMKRSLGQHLYIEAGGKAVYAPLVRRVPGSTTFMFTVADDEQLEEVYGNLAPFVKK